MSKAKLSKKLSRQKCALCMADTSLDATNTDGLLRQFVTKKIRLKTSLKEVTDETGDGQEKDILQSFDLKFGSEAGLVYVSYDYTASMSSRKMFANIDGA